MDDEEFKDSIDSDLLSKKNKMIPPWIKYLIIIGVIVICVIIFVIIIIST